MLVGWQAGYFAPNVLMFFMVGSAARHGVLFAHRRHAACRLRAAVADVIRALDKRSHEAAMARCHWYAADSGW